jgi:carboxyl-terminal processing protease
MRLQLEGIGALLRQDNGQTIVSEIVPGGAAAADGHLKVDDKIIGVAQGDSKFTDVLDMKLRDVVKLIRGKRGTKVELKVIPAGKVEPVVYAFNRQKIELKDQAARAELIEQGKKADGSPYHILVIDLPSFYADMSARPGSGGKSATEDVRKILNEFAGKMDGVILDIRHNGGGSLTEARALTGLFIDQGPVVQVKGTRGKVQHLDDPERGVVYGGPLMVLDSKMSASASEILSGALQDYGRALIVGDSTTHGKGTVQVLLDLGDQLEGKNPPKLGALKLTIQQFYRVNGDSTQDRGVASDIIIPSLTDVAATGEKELEYALPFDKVKPIPHEQLNLISEELKASLRAKSTARIKASADFTKLAKEIDGVKTRKERKAFPLNEQELKEQFSKDDAERADQGGELPPEQPKDTLVYKFKRDFTNNEILRMMEDFLQARPAAAIAR